MTRKVITQVIGKLLQTVLDYIEEPERRYRLKTVTELEERIGQDIPAGK